MNFALILKLSGFGLMMAFATVFLIPSNLEPAFWLPIFLVSAFLIARFAPGKFFLHGLLTSLANCVWITGAHIALYAPYMAHHPQEAAMTANMPMPGHPRLMMLLFGPVVGLASGLVLGVFSMAMSKWVPGNRRRAGA